MANVKIYALSGRKELPVLCYGRKRGKFFLCKDMWGDVATQLNASLTTRLQFQSLYYQTPSNIGDEAMRDDARPDSPWKRRSHYRNTTYRVRKKNNENLLLGLGKNERWSCRNMGPLATIRCQGSANIREKTMGVQNPHLRRIRGKETKKGGKRKNLGPMFGLKDTFNWQNQATVDENTACEWLGRENFCGACRWRE